MTIEIYEKRTSTVYNIALDEGRFHLLNHESIDALALTTCYCLDAPDTMPAGSMYSYRSGNGIAERWVPREEPSPIQLDIAAKMIGALIAAKVF